MSRERTVIGTEVLLVVGLLGFVGAIWGIEKGMGLKGPVGLHRLVGLGLAAIPALLWLGYFYLQDRKEPEPKHFVLGVYLLGGLAAWPIAEFLLGTFMPRPHSGLHWNSPDELVRTLILVGLSQELAKYLVVRYTIYYSDEFDEPMDGIIYMTAAGIGFATAQNYVYLESLDGSVLLSMGVMNVVVGTLAHSCFAGVMGYALAHARFGGPSAGARVGWLLGGLVVAALLNGGFALLQQALVTDGVKVKPWRGLAGAAAFAAVIFFVLSMLMRRHQEAPAAGKA